MARINKKSALNRCSALFELNTPPSPGAVSLEECDQETELACDGDEVARRRPTSRNRPQSHALLGNFEESALNGRLEPVSTVHGFAAELAASGSFCPKHRKLPVTVFFYTLGDNDKISSPYLVSSLSFDSFPANHSFPANSKNASVICLSRLT